VLFVLGADSDWSEMKRGHASEELKTMQIFSAARKCPFQKRRRRGEVQGEAGVSE